jgi:signal transduction histidine kinase
VNEVLDFARPIRCEVGPTDLNALCRNAAEASLSGESAPGISLRLDPQLPGVMTDGERVRTALVNILSNAREAVAARSGEATGPPGAPEVELTTLQANGGVTIVIADRGIGIAPADLPHVFDPYFTTRRTGTGLGLAIAKNIIEALGGAITVRSRPSEGTEVRIELPATATLPRASSGGART